MVTASVDHTVKLWDLRNIKDKKSFLHEMPHDMAVNSGKKKDTIKIKIDQNKMI